MDDVAIPRGEAALQNQVQPKLIVGNWKMNGTLADLCEIEEIAQAAADARDVQVGLALPASLILLAANHSGNLLIGAQDVDIGDEGRSTGCLSAAMLQNVGARFSLVGHSERRAQLKEQGAAIRQKIVALWQSGMGAILCVGETLTERQGNRAVCAVIKQMLECLPQQIAGWLAIAYEPVWAVGAGRDPQVAEIAAMHGALRTALGEVLLHKAAAIRLLYGGSVSQENARSILYCPDVDGVLVGSASLKAETYIPIIKAAAGQARSNETAEI